MKFGFLPGTEKSPNDTNLYFWGNFLKASPNFKEQELLIGKNEQEVEQLIIAVTSLLTC